MDPGAQERHLGTRPVQDGHQLQEGTSEGERAEPREPSAAGDTAFAGARTRPAGQSRSLWTWVTGGLPGKLCGISQPNVRSLETASRVLAFSVDGGLDVFCLVPSRTLVSCLCLLVRASTHLSVYPARKRDIAVLCQATRRLRDFQVAAIFPSCDSVRRRFGGSRLGGKGVPLASSEQNSGVLLNVHRATDGPQPRRSMWPQ